MISLADAGGRIMYSYKELSELAGYTSRVYNMIQVMQDLHENRFVRTGAADAEFGLDQIEGKVVDGYDGIKFEHVPVSTPTGDVLVKDLNVSFAQGMAYFHSARDAELTHLLKPRRPLDDYRTQWLWKDLDYAATFGTLAVISWHHLSAHAVVGVNFLHSSAAVFISRLFAGANYLSAQRGGHEGERKD